VSATSLLQRVVCCSVMQCVVVCCSLLQCVAVCTHTTIKQEEEETLVSTISLLQCVAMCCSALQCVVCCTVYLHNNRIGGGGNTSTYH